MENKGVILAVKIGEVLLNFVALVFPSFVILTRHSWFLNQGPQTASYSPHPPPPPTHTHTHTYKPPPHV